MACVDCDVILTLGSGETLYEYTVYAYDPDNIPLTLLSALVTAKDGVGLADTAPSWFSVSTAGSSTLVGGNLVYELAITLFIDATDLLTYGSGEEGGEGTYTFQFTVQTEDASKDPIVCEFTICIEGSDIAPAELEGPYLFFWGRREQWTADFGIALHVLDLRDPAGTFTRLFEDAVSSEGRAVSGTLIRGARHGIYEDFLYYVCKDAQGATTEGEIRKMDMLNGFVDERIVLISGSTHASGRCNCDAWNGELIFRLGSSGEAYHYTVGGSLITYLGTGKAGSQDIGFRRDGEEYYEIGSTNNTIVRRRLSDGAILSSHTDATHSPESLEIMPPVGDPDGEAVAVAYRAQKADGTDIKIQSTDPDTVSDVTTLKTITRGLPGFSDGALAFDERGERFYMWGENALGEYVLSSWDRDFLEADQTDEYKGFQINGPRSCFVGYTTANIFGGTSLVGGLFILTNTGTLYKTDEDGQNSSTLVTGLGSDCRAIVRTDSYLFYTDRGTESIYRLDHDGTNKTTIISSLNNCAGLAHYNGKLYFTEGAAGLGTLKRMNTDGSGVETLASGGRYFHCAVDTVNERVYASDFGGGTVDYYELVSPFTKTNVATLASVYSVGVDSNGTKVYFSAFGSSDIYSKNKDGTGSNLLMATTISGGDTQQFSEYPGGLHMYFGTSEYAFRLAKVMDQAGTPGLVNLGRTPIFTPGSLAIAGIAPEPKT